MYLVRLKSNQRYVRKTLTRTGRLELEIYRRLQEYGNHSCHSGFRHFILRWSTGYWSAGWYLQLPFFVPLSDEIERGHLEGRSLLLCAQLVNGVNYLHSRLKIAHMDIKPNNLLLDSSVPSRPTLKIIDFNLAIVDADCLVPPGARRTEGYMAPEVQEEAYFPFLADQYSCGVCLETFLVQDQDQNQQGKQDFAVFAKQLCATLPWERPPLMECARFINPVAMPSWIHCL